MNEKKNTKTELTEEQKKQRAIEILQQALINAINNGVEIKLANYHNKFVVIMEGYNKVDGNITPCEK